MLIHVDPTPFSLRSKDCGASTPGRQEHKVNALTVIVPALNAAHCLPATLGMLRSAAVEILVVDGGSSDGTVACAAAAGVRVLHAPRGRGAQLSAGITAATSDWLLLLHADTRLESGWEHAVRELMAGDPRRAGYFRFALDSGAPQARRLERAVAWRCRHLGLPYGDQGLLISRDLLDELGGIRPLPLMEDVDLVRRIGKRRLAALQPAALTSAVRWQRQGWVARSARNLGCLALYLAGVPPRWIARLYG